MTRNISLLFAVLLVQGLAGSASAAEASPGTDALPRKQASAFYPGELIAHARENIARYDWAAAMGRRIIAAAEPWMKLSDDELWSLMFGNTLKRSWMVWSDGHCPSCQTPVPMYNWIIHALDEPWKVRCPHCSELFPKNDFQLFYRSGLDEHGIFQPDRADRSLLFNVEHPDPDDPLHVFGVDDGDGYVEGGKRWRFINAYLIYGQWKQAVVIGARNLAAAHVVTGDPAYARKAGILLDRIADLYPTFDFHKEGVLYEGPGVRGYVSTWHDAAVEVRVLALAYDQVFDALARDQELVEFLDRKAKEFKIERPKASFADIQANIEERILHDTLRNRPKIESNYPMTDVTIIYIRTVLGWPGNRDEIMALIDPVLATSTAVDGLTGEKGLAGYSVTAPHATADLLGRYARIDPKFLTDTLQRQPRLHQMYRFHLDTWCLEKYYPLSGDTLWFAHPSPKYLGVPFPRAVKPDISRPEHLWGPVPGFDPSGYAFLWSLYETTGDADFLRLLYKANGGTAQGLPYDLFAPVPATFQARVEEHIARAGTEIRLGSVNKEEWCLAILRSGKGPDARAVWLDYDSGERHGHADAMNLGLFAYGLDLMPDFGYPPVHYGGWGSPRAVWYTMSAAHNTVVVDRKNSLKGTGNTTLWADGQQFRAIRASAAPLIGGQQFERTIASVDVSESDFYIIDIFRVVGGTEHIKFMHSHFGELATPDLSLQPGDEYGHGTIMRNFLVDRSPPPAWTATWKVEDRLGLLPEPKDVRLRYTSLTPDAQVSTAEGWVSVGGFSTSEEAWIPRLLISSKAAEPPLASTFVGIIDPFVGTSSVVRARRLVLESADGDPLPESFVALEASLADGSRDVLVAADIENPLAADHSSQQHELVQKELGIRFSGDLCLVRFSPGGNLVRVAVCGGQSLQVGRMVIRLRPDSGYMEICFKDGVPDVVSGPRVNLLEIVTHDADKG